MGKRRAPASDGLPGWRDGWRSPPRMGKKGVHHGFNLARQERIIRIEQADHVSGRVSVRGIQVGRHAAVRIAQQAYSVTTADIGFNHLAGIVLGGIIAYDDFRRRVGLRQHALNGLTNIGSVVETSDQNGNGWPLGQALQERSGRVGSALRMGAVLSRDHAVSSAIPESLSAIASQMPVKYSDASRRACAVE